MAALNVTLNQISQLSKMFPNAKGISVTENTICVNFSDRNQSILHEVADNLNGTDVRYNDIKGKEIDEGEVIEALLNSIERLQKKVDDLHDAYNAAMYECDLQEQKAEDYKADAIKWAKKYDDAIFEHRQMKALYATGNLIWKED